ncbi:MAG: PilW family protein [Burkholderiaceae bacterium]|nr:PilW family protein [Burkholderiaceae bacterium]MDO9090975.1 PilW family protein [Burkholderiaceae bacterium]
MSRLHASRRGRRQWGRSLIEVMISITIGLAVLGAILTVYLSTSSTSRQSESATRMSEDAAVAMTYMGNYIRMAGFSFPLANGPANTVVSGTASVEFTDSNFGGTAIRGCDNGFSNPTVTSTSALSCNSGSGNSAIAVRFEGDTDNTWASGGSPTDCLGQAVTTTVASDYDASVSYSRIEARFFTAVGANSGTRELYCAGNGSASFAAQPLLQYVDSMVITYGLASDVSSHRVVQYATAAQIDALPGDVDQRWKRVISAKICLIMRSETADQGGAQPYIDCAGTLVTPNDNFMRRAFSSVVTLRNRGGFAL